MAANVHWIDRLRDAVPFELSALRQFEASLGRPLPGAYVKLLQQQNGGYIQNCMFSVKIDGGSELSTVDPFYFLGPSSNRSTYNLWNCLALWRRNGGSLDLIPIAGDGMGGELLLNIASETGSVLMVQGESNEVHLVAPSFDEFLTQLHMPRD
ncbi:MAG: SMI1/KNR4 family protein [Planctomycetes bacterium]|nr:SMI1/KNR4 family protein [Planctomycetota bacterium]